MSYEVPYAIGTYTGNGSDPRLISTGFYPEFLMLFGRNLVPQGYFLTRDKYIDDGTSFRGTDGSFSNADTDLDLENSGFAVAGNANLNTIIYSYIAFQKSAQFIAGKYTGSGAARLIPIGFKPDVALIMRDQPFASGGIISLKLANHPTNRFTTFEINCGTITTANGFLLVDGGIKLGSGDAATNVSSNVYYYVALSLRAGLRGYIGSYTGGATDVYVHTGARPRFTINETDSASNINFKCDEPINTGAIGCSSNTSTDWFGTTGVLTFGAQSFTPTNTLTGTELNRYLVLF